jgi:hypothetical protein
MFGNQTLLCQMVLPVRSCAAAIRPDREGLGEGVGGAASGPLRVACDKGQVPWRARLLARLRTIQACPKDRLTFAPAGWRCGKPAADGGRLLV